MGLFPILCPNFTRISEYPLKVYSPADMADLLQVKVSTIRKYSIMLESHGYEFDKNSRQQRFYTDADVITLRKLITFKDNGMTLDESVEAVLLWHNGNESEDQSITPYRTDTHNITDHDRNDISEMKAMMQKQNEMIGELTKRLDKQERKDDEREWRIEERDRRLMETLSEVRETKKLIAAEAEAEEKRGFFRRLFNK